MCPLFLPSFSQMLNVKTRPKKKERTTGFEPATPSLGSSYSTAELCPLSFPGHNYNCMLVQIQETPTWIHVSVCLETLKARIEESSLAKQ